MRPRGIATVAGMLAGLLLVPATARAADDPGASARAARPGASRTAGATPTTPDSRLQTILRTLSRSARLTGTAWLADPRSGTVVVIADRTVTGARLDRLKAVTGPYGGAVRLRRVSGKLGVRLSGGDPVTGGSYRCTAGANLTAGGAYYFATAGHCGSAATTWYTLAGAFIGPTAATRFPGDDFAVVRYTGAVPHEGTVGSQDITSAGNAHVGEHVCMRGGTSGVHCGTVLGLNATVNYAQGTVSGLIQTNICSEPGDSGSPLYDGGILLGLLSGGSGNCTSGGVTFFQPITEILSMYGLSVY